MGGWRPTWFSMRNSKRFMSISLLSVSFSIPTTRASDTLQGASGLNDGRLAHQQAEAFEVSTPAGLIISLMISYYQNSIIPGLLDCLPLTHTLLYYAEAHIQVCGKAFMESLVISVQTPHISCCHSSPPTPQSYQMALSLYTEVLEGAANC